MNILFLTARFPYPTIGGDRLKPNMILKHLAKNHNVHLVSFYQGKENPADYVKVVENMGVHVYYVNLSPLTAGLKALLRSSSFPLEIGYYYDSRIKKIVDELITKENIDLGFSFFMRTAEYLKNHNIKKILMAEDCRVLYQKRSYEKSTKFHQKLVRYWEYKKLTKYEPKIVEYFDSTTFVTEVDISEMKKQNSNARYDLCTNGTDINKFKSAETQKSAKSILFAGKLDVWANQMMSEKIINEIFPKIQKEIKDVKLKIVGANPPQFLVSLQNDSIEVKANVPDMLPYLQEASLFLHPHDGGSGIQNKLLEAMSCGCPVVTTPTGNQGINAAAGKDLLIGSTMDELAENAISILKDTSLAEKISKNAREHIINTHSWEAVYKDLDILIDLVMNS